jgi:predicted AAA+ superfamily ATPase
MAKGEDYESIYFTDTGLAAYLTKWISADVLESGAMARAFFENYVVMEIIKSFLNAGQEAPVYFYRDKDQIEIDMIVRQGDTLYPIGIKKHADPSKRDIAAFTVLDRSPGMKRGAGSVVCMVDQLLPMSTMDFAVPVHYL